MAYVSKIKDPHARLDYLWPWADWLPASDRIVAVTFTVYDDEGNEIDTDVDLNPVVVDEFSFTDTTATAWLVDGTLDNDYLVVCHITTEQAREEDQTLRLRIRNK